jgi:two-component system, OmpR family, heavy metal sensor histidine kinase CusS
MRWLPLRVKIALWTALSAGAIIAVALLGIHFFLNHQLMEIVDQRIERDAQDVFRNLDLLPGGPLENRANIDQSLIPQEMQDRLLEIQGRERKVLYASPNLQGETLIQKTPQKQEFTLAGTPYRIATYYHKFIVLRIGYPLGNYYATLKRLRLGIYFAFPAVVMLSFGGGLLVANRALRPVQRITAAAERITADDLHQRLPVPAARDEVHKLTQVLNKTFERLESSYQQAVHFASEASHQLKTPITVMRIAIEHMMAKADARSAQEMSDLLQQTRRLSSMADALLLLARADAGRLCLNIERVDLAPVLNACLEDTELLGEKQKLTIVRKYPPMLLVIADGPRIEQVILNLLENAVKYNRPCGTITVSGSRTEDRVVIRIANTGHPIPPEKAPQIFQRFARGETNEARTGHGLGLCIARELTLAQGGELKLVQSDEQCTVFELALRTTRSDV